MSLPNLATRPQRDPAAVPALLTIAAIGIMLVSFAIGFFGAGSSSRRAAQPNVFTSTPIPPAVTSGSGTLPEGNSPPPSSGPMDLLALINTSRDVPLPEVARAGERFTIRSRGGFTCAVVPYDLPRNYQLDLAVTSRSGDGLLIGFPVSGQRAMFTIDGFKGEPPDGRMRTALETIDRFRPHDRGYPGHLHYGQLLGRNVESKIAIRVVDNSITLTCNGQQIVQWTGEPSRLAIYGPFNQGAPRRMFLGSWAATYEVASLRLTPL